MTDVNISLECAECHHSRGLIYYANPLAWGRPCRRCRKMMSKSVVVVPTQIQAAPAQVQATPVQVQAASQVQASLVQVQTTPAQVVRNTQTTTTTTTTTVPIRVNY